jgi:DNA-binding NarL/FixJ family response regulator
MKVFLVEDSAAIRERVVKLIEADGRHQVVGEAISPEPALRGILATQAEMAIFDVRLDQGNGIEAMAEAKRRSPALIAIVITNEATAQYRKASIEAGASCFLDKTDLERIADVVSSFE